MPRKQTKNDDDKEYNNKESKLLKKEINRLKRELREIKKVEGNEEKVVEYKALIATKQAEFDKIQFSLFAEDMKSVGGITLHAPRQAA